MQSTIGLDIAENVFQVHGVGQIDRAEAVGIPAGRLRIEYTA